MGIPKKVTDAGTETRGARPKRTRGSKKTSSEVPEGYARDPKTGKVYRRIPKLDIDKKGFAPLVLDDLAGITEDPVKNADDYLGHLRVAPDEKELAELRATAKRQSLENRREYEDRFKKKSGDSKS